jgi:cytochrome o ubiquinol oxidase subunit 2
MSKKKSKLPLFIILALGGLTLLVFMAYRGTVAVLEPKGTIAEAQFRLMLFTALLSLVVIIPVYALAVHVSRKYRADNTKAKYRPDHDHSRVAEAIWWLVPLALISILAVITWVSSHNLDPFKPIASNKKPLTIQVVALQWKWLFIYPEQNIATVNQVMFPVNTPVKFEITSDAPMNSFWIPQLGGQIYAMSGMSTNLNLQATKIGSYRGSSANISGEGFAGMKFTASAASQNNFDTWVDAIRRVPNRDLNTRDYVALAKPSKDVAPAAYASVDPGLYGKVIMKYTTPGMQDMGQHTTHAEPEKSDTHTHQGMDY